MMAWLVSSSWATSSFSSAVFSVRMERKLDNVSSPWYQRVSNAFIQRGYGIEKVTSSNLLNSLIAVLSLIVEQVLFEATRVPSEVHGDAYKS